MNLEEIKSRINPTYADTIGTESYERKWLVGEIESLRQQLADEKLCHQETKEQLAECERERDEVLTALGLPDGVHSPVQVINELASSLEDMKEQLAGCERDRDRAEQQVKELLWDDPEDEPSFGPTWGDLLVYLNKQKPFPEEMYSMMRQGAKKWMQMKEQLKLMQEMAEALEWQQGGDLRKAALTKYKEMMK